MCKPLPERSALALHARPSSLPLSMRGVVWLALGLIAVCSTSAGDLPARRAAEDPGTAQRAHTAAATSRVHAESAVAAELVRLVPPSFRGHGPDVARYQHPDGKPIDWAAAKRSGVGYAFIKATEGTTVVNPWFRADWAGAGNVGLPRGAYHFARPNRPLSTATAQARAFLAVAGRLDRAGDMPAVLDLESSGGLAPGELVAWAQEWVRTVQNATGRAPLLYTYRSFWRRSAGNSTALNHLPLWIADYSDGVAGAGRAAGPTRPLIGGWQDWAIWQWTDDGRIPGVAGPVDVNVFNGGAPRMRELADGTRRSDFDPVLPGAPGRVRADGGDGSLTVSWLPGFDGNSRTLGWRVRVDGTTRSVLLPAHAMKTRVTGLRNGRTYDVVVEQRNAAGWSSPSRAVTVATLPATSVTGLLVAADAVPAGGAVAAVAQVRADGLPVPAAKVQFWTSRGDRKVLAGTASTGPDGKARIELTLPATSLVQARFAGRPGTKPSRSGQAEVVAVPRLTVDVPETARNGRPMGVTGSAVGAPLGSKVQLQQLTKRGWVPVGTVRVQAKGRFTFVLRAAAGVRQFRVVVPETRSTGRIQSKPGSTSITAR